MNSGNLVGGLTSYPNGAELPPDGVDQVVYLFYHLEDFENCAALLRNQKTIYLNYNGSGARNGLQTGATIPGTFSAITVQRAYAARVRDIDVIDSELRLLAAVRWSIREHGGEPSSHQVDELLDEPNELPGR